MFIDFEDWLGQNCHLIYMRRINKILQKELDKPRSYEELKRQPFPYLEECNRLQIFEFVHHLEMENQKLKSQIAQKYPQKTTEEILEENKRMFMNNEMLRIDKNSIQSMQTELKDKTIALQQFNTKNEELTQKIASFQAQMRDVEIKAVEVESEKKKMEFQLKLHNQRKNRVDISQLFKNMYQDVREILQESL